MIWSNLRWSIISKMMISNCLLYPCKEMQWTSWGLEALRDWMEQAPIEAQIDGPTVSAVCSRQFRFQLEVRWHFPEGASMQSGYPGLAVFVLSAGESSGQCCLICQLWPFLDTDCSPFYFALLTRTNWYSRVTSTLQKATLVFTLLPGKIQGIDNHLQSPLWFRPLLSSKPDKSWSPRRKGEG